MQFESDKSFLGTLFTLLVIIGMLFLSFMLIKLAWVEVFGIWAISLTANQSTSLGWLTLLLLNAIGGRNKK